MSADTFRYDDAIVRKFLIATLLWGVVGMLVGLLIATQLADWRMNLGISWQSPLRTKQRGRCGIALARCSMPGRARPSMF